MMVTTSIAKDKTHMQHAPTCSYRQNKLWSGYKLRFIKLFNSFH